MQKISRPFPENQPKRPVKKQNLKKAGHKSVLRARKGDLFVNFLSLQSTGMQ
jgi:hypothetical protein